jgi:hypothetical protein
MRTFASRLDCISRARSWGSGVRSAGLALAPNRGRLPRRNVWQCPQVWRRSKFRRFPRRSAQTRKRRICPLRLVWEVSGLCWRRTVKSSINLYAHSAFPTRLNLFRNAGVACSSHAGGTMKPARFKTDRARGPGEFAVGGCDPAHFAAMECDSKIQLRTLSACRCHASGGVLGGFSNARLASSISPIR